MARKWYGSDAGLSFRMFVTMFLLTALYFAFLTFLWYQGADFFTMIFVAGIFLGAQYYFSDRMVLWSMGAKVVDRDEAPELHDIVERLSQTVDIPKPKIAIVQSEVPNAFATGRSINNSVVAVTTGLTERLDTPEVEAVLAHELSHVKNRDVVVMTLASFFSTVAFFIMRYSVFGMYGGFGRRRDRGGSIALVYLASLMVWLISYMLIRALSRYRELAADRGSAIITGAPSQLASALVKISSSMQRIPTQDLRQVEGMNAFFIVPAISGQSFLEIFSTHPSLERRLEQLKRLEQEMEKV